MLETQDDIKLRWLMRIRWGAVLGQLGILVLAKWGLKLSIGALPALVLISLIVVSNVLLTVWKVKPQRMRQIIGVVLVADTILLSLLLYYYGGHTNPFSMMYLVHVTLAAVLLGVSWTWLTVGLSTAGYLLLFFFHRPVSELSMHAHHGGEFDLHLHGMLVAFVAISALLGYFLTRMSGALEKQEVELRRYQLNSLREQQLASLTTLAAGAAHELGTPLSTIAIAASELQRTVPGDASLAHVREDVQLIRQEVVRCQSILQRMRGDAGDLQGEAISIMTIGQLITDISGKLDALRIARFYVEGEADLEVAQPRSGLVTVLFGLIRNAFEASAESDPVRLTVSRQDGRIEFQVIDQGRGIPHDQISRVGEPFFTTKDPGSGMGLGVFLAKLFVDRVGGTLKVESELASGTTVRVNLPLRAA